MTAAMQDTYTIAEAATELARLFTAFNGVAVDLTGQYIQECLAGEEGVTYHKIGGVPKPILPVAVRQNGVVLVNAGYSFDWTLSVDYRLSRTPMLVPSFGDGTFDQTDAILVSRASKGFDPGAKYVAFGGQVSKAGYNQSDVRPTVGDHGGFAWSIPRWSVTDTFCPLTEADGDLRDAIAWLRAREPKTA